MQRKRCVELLRNAKEAHYSKIKIKDINNNKKLWTVIKPIFSEKMTTNETLP